MSREKGRNKCRKKRTVALFLAVLLALSPCLSLLWGNVTARAESFTIKKLKDNSIVKDGNFTFYGSKMKAELFYWIKSDGSPLFCIQKTASLIPGLNGGETVQEFGSSQYLDEKKYELVSLVLQCCGMIKGESPVLEPGTYLAGQAAVWGITSANWTDTQRFRREMENVYAHIGDWHDVPKEEIIGKSREAVERISQAIDDYYGDNSPYIPSFASKYEKKAPVWKVEREEDGSGEITFALDGKSEAIKEFVFELPDGWTYEWQEDGIIFHGENLRDGEILVEGKAGEGSVLEEAMPIGLVYIVGPSSYPSFQRLASDVELKAVWSCYFKLLVTEPEDPGNWYLPEVDYYRHQETFKSIYGAGIEKLDGETQEPIAGVEFQPLEYFDARQLDGTVLDKQQISTWTGWKARCAPSVTDQDGKLEHWDEHEYLYDKTYCSGHPAPEITYKGNSQKRREQLEEEAEEAWESAVEECSRRCDFHRIDSTGQECMEEDRDLAYQQFIHLVYGYTFQETRPAEGYLPHGEHEKDEEIERVFLTSVQAGGEQQEEKFSVHNLNQARTLITRRQIGNSNTETKIVKGMETEGKRDDGVTASKSNIEKSASKHSAEKTVSKHSAEKTASKYGAEKTTSKYDVEKRASKSSADKAASRSDAKKTKAGPTGEIEETVLRERKKQRKQVLVWLTSLVPFLEQQTPNMDLFYEFIVKNYKPEEPPEETTPEETTPEETTPEETTPEETPEETTPEETPEETTPEETPPEETTPEETMPEETPPQETLPQETPVETVPQTAAPPKPSRTPGGSGGNNKRIESIPPVFPTETQPFVFLTEELVPQAGQRIGWITARYASSSTAQKKRGEKGSSPVSLPGTGDRGIGMVLLLLLTAGSGSIVLLLIKRQRKKERKTRLFSIVFFCLVFFSVGAWEVRAAELDENRLFAPDGDKLIVYYSAEEASLGDGEGGILESLTDESGQIYWLESCCLVRQDVPEKEEWITEVVEYAAVENEKQIPESIVYQMEDKDTGREGEGELAQTAVVSADVYWTADFQVPLTFYDYDADGYRLNGMEVPGEGALAYLMENQQRFLEMINCPPDRYQVDQIIWSGDSYPFGDMLCRDALVLGKKQVSDRAIEYSGTIVYPEMVQERWEAVYAPQISAYPQEDSASENSIPEMIPEDHAGEEKKAQETSFPKKTFSWFSYIAAYTISFAVFFPVLLYIILFVLKKKRGKMADK